MLRFALKLLLRDRLRFGVTALGVAAAVVLILALNGIFAGSARQISTYIERSGADIFVAQAGVRNIHMASSFLPADLSPRIEAVPGVSRAVPMVYLSTTLKVAGKRHAIFPIGLPPGAEFGGAWEVTAGRALAGAGEVVMSDDLARRHGTGLGDDIRVAGRTLRVSGLAEGLESLASSFAFVSLEDAQAMRGSGPLVSYYLVRVAPGTDAARVVKTIEERLDKVSAMTREDLAASDRAIALQMGVSVLQAMAVAGFLVGLAVVGLSIYATAVEQLRQFGMLKAVGASRGHLLAAFVLQAQVVALSGFVLGVSLTLLLRPLVPKLVPGLELDLTPSFVLITLVEVLVIGALAALPPWWRVSRLDPMLVFK